jgi:competence protein CoiA
MFVSLDANGARCTLTSHAQATDLRRSGAQFFCPACHGEVIIRNGTQIPAHFAHRSNACTASEPESGEHLQGKLLLAEMGRSSGWNAELEVYVPEIKQRIDVLLTRGDKRVALEFQCSPIAVPLLAARTAGYRHINLPVRWILGHRYNRLGAALKFAVQDDAGHLCTEHLDVQRKELRLRVDLHSNFCAEQVSWPVPTQLKVTGQMPDLVKSANSVTAALHYRSPKIVRLQNACYARGLNLAGCPWVVHAHCLELAGLALPEWALRVYWLLQFTGRPISAHANAQFWAQAVQKRKMPLIDWSAYVARITPMFCSELEKSGFLIAECGGWQWCKPPVWYPDIDHKLAALTTTHGI